MVTPEAAFQEEGTHFFHAGLIQAVEGARPGQKLRLFHHGLGDAQTLPHTHGVFPPTCFRLFGVQAIQLHRRCHLLFGDGTANLGQEPQVLESGIAGQESRLFDDDAHGGPCLPLAAGGKEFLPDPGRSSRRCISSAPFCRSRSGPPGREFSPFQRRRTRPSGPSALRRIWSDCGFQFRSYTSPPHLRMCDLDVHPAAPEDDQAKEDSV